jgi:hypothetical protein
MNKQKVYDDLLLSLYRGLYFEEGFKAEQHVFPFLRGE